MHSVCILPCCSKSMMTFFGVHAWIASCRAVPPLGFQFMWWTLAPYASNWNIESQTDMHSRRLQCTNAAQSIWPWTTAMMSGVLPLRSSASTRLCLSGNSRVPTSNSYRILQLGSFKCETVVSRSHFQFCCLSWLGCFVDSDWSWHSWVLAKAKQCCDAAKPLESFHIATLNSDSA